MGDVVNSLCHLTNMTGRDGRKIILVTSKVYNNITEKMQELLYSCKIDGITHYEGNLIWRELENWYIEICK